MAELKVKHPATFSKSILERLDEMVPAGQYLDPFGGTGKLHSLTNDHRSFLLVELEPEWAAVSAEQGPTICADSLEWMEEWARSGVSTFSGIVTSPVYGNRMSDHHNATDASTRRSYKFDLGRDLSDNNAGAMYFWQEEYRDFHMRAWAAARGVTAEGGRMYLNAKNFIRNRQPQHVVGWHVKALTETGWTVRKIAQVSTPSLRHGENHDARFDTEAIIIAINGG